jgi:hypothetical protein
MTEAKHCILPGRAVLDITGPDRETFLQGIVSNDVARVARGEAVHAAFLTPQGKYLADFFIVAAAESWRLDTAAEGAEPLAKRLGMYKLRSQVTIEPAHDAAVIAVFGQDALAALDLPATRGAAVEFAGGVAFADPRLTALGARLIGDKTALTAKLDDLGIAEAPFAAYDARRLALGVPDGPRDLKVEKATLMESGFHELNGLDWQKGCYLGQELTARMYYRGLAKKRLLPVRIEGPAPAPGADLTLDGRSMGEMRSSEGDRGLALVKLAALDAGAGETGLEAGDARVFPELPDWIELKRAGAAE